MRETIEKAEARRLLDSLTSKQAETLELAQFHVNKEVAYKLGISPSTVEQRLTAVREKLGTSSRNTTIKRYAELKSICGETIYGFSHIASSSETEQSLLQDQLAGSTWLSGLEGLDARYGMWWRPVMVVILAGIIVISAVLVVNLATTVSGLVS